VNGQHPKGLKTRQIVLVIQTRHHVSRAEIFIDQLAEAIVRLIVEHGHNDIDFFDP
jgi:hypothetical protein